MDGKNLLVVACVLEARNLSLPPSCSLVVEGKLGGEMLSSDPVPASHPGALEVNTELAWEMSRRSLQQHKLQRTPIKLQCCAVDTRTGAKQPMGYILLDLRSAQQSVHQPQSNWHGLLNSRGGAPRPELCVSLTVEEDGGGSQTPGGVAPGGIPPGRAPEARNGPDSALAPPLSLVLTLDSSGGYYSLGPPHLQQHMFTLSLTLQNPTNLPRSSGHTGSQWYFYYSLLGNDITSEPFSSDMFRPERASVRVQTTRELIGTLLSAQEDIQLHLCCGEQSVASGTVSMATLASSNQLEQSVVLRPQSQQETSMLSLATVDVVMQIDTAHGSPVPQGVGGHPVQPRGSATKGVSPPPPTSQPPPTSAGRQATTTPTAQEAGSTSTGGSSVKRNLTHSFDEAVRESGRRASEDEGTRGGHVNGIPAAGGTYTAPVPATASVPAATLAHSTATAGPSGPTVSYTHTSRPTAGPSGPTVSYTHTSRPTEKADMPTYRGEGTGITKSSDPTHHFRFSIDIRSLHNLQMNPNVQHYLRYSYQFFGCPYPVLVHPPTAVPLNMERPFLQSYCAFDFATPYQRLHHQLTTKPLHIEVWQSCDSRNGLQDQIMGVAKVNLGEVLSSQRVLIGGDSSGVTRQLCSLRVPVTPSLPPYPPPSLPHVPPVTTCGYLHTCLVLEDHGVVMTAGSPTPVEDVSGEKGSQAGAPQSGEAPLEYKAALELEMWKMAEEEAFQEELRSREKAHMTRLAEEWDKRDQQRQQLLKQKMDHYTELEKSLQNTLRDVQEQQCQLQQKEREISMEKSRLSQELESAQAKADALLLQARTVCEHEIKLERLRANELERQVLQLKQQVSELEHRCTTKDSEFEAYRKQLLNKPETSLQAQVNMLHLEKGELERKLSAAVKSKQHYKEQWTKALREIAAVRQREQAAAREHLQRQQEELEVMRAQFLQQETQRSIRSQLDDIKSDVNRLQQQTLATESVNPSTTTTTAQPGPQPSCSGGDAVMESEVARWIEERDILLQTGVYTSADPTIQRLDQRIRKAIAQQSQQP